MQQMVFLTTLISSSHGFDLKSCPCIVSAPNILSITRNYSPGLE